MSDKKQTREEKAAALKAERATRRIKRSDVTDEFKIKLMVDDNPRRVGSAPHDHFNKYEDEMLIKDFFSEDVEGSWVHLQADVERGYVQLLAA